MNQIKQFKLANLATSVTLAAALVTGSTAFANDESQQLTPLAPKAQPMPTQPQLSQNPADYKPDPAKRLTLENFKVGLSKLHGYLENAVKNAPEEDKKFLIKEKAEIERQMIDPQKTLDELFASIEAQIARLKQQKIFPPLLIAQVNKFYLDTEAARSIGVMRQEAKKQKDNYTLHAEVEYQLGIIAERDQVNYKASLRHYGKAVQLAPSNPEYLTALGRVYMIIEDYGSASKLYQDVLNRFGKDPSLAKWTGEIKSQLKKAKKHL